MRFTIITALITQPGIKLTRPRSVAQIPLGLSRHVSTRHDTFDVSSPCILVVSSSSKSTARHARFDTSNVSCRVETWRAKWNLGLCRYDTFYTCTHYVVVWPRFTFSSGQAASWRCWSAPDRRSAWRSCVDRAPTGIVPTAASSSRGTVCTCRRSPGALRLPVQRCLDTASRPLVVHPPATTINHPIKNVHK